MPPVASAGDSKRIKDPVYGYIELPRELCERVIDTAEFQRLRRVVQTSYAPLYPSALHNRFVHSLGVYHLGQLAAESLDQAMRCRYEESLRLDKWWPQSKRTFLLACLLHDVGHAPFSHTGEGFYRGNDSGAQSIDELLEEAVGDERFKRDASMASNKAAPHEVMSALIGIDRFVDTIGEENRELFARCITGYRYLHPANEDEHLGNILIELLNSSTIDVDKLDYLIRDAYVIGFDSIAIDYSRLLRGIRLTGRTGHPRLVFHKSALSVLENVVYARDLEKKWVQSHPVILYEQYLVQHMASAANTKFCPSNGRSLFSLEALSVEGLQLNNGLRVALMSDDDLVFLAKQCESCDSQVLEYFARGVRKHPVWKSEAEYGALFRLGADKDAQAAKDLENAFEGIASYLKEKGEEPVLSEKTIQLLDCELSVLGERADASPLLAEKGPELEDQKRLLEELRDYSTICGIDFEYVLLDQKSFSSGFESEGLGNIEVVFSDDATDSYKFGNLMPSLSSKSHNELQRPIESRRIFYLYHARTNEGKFSANDLAERLIAAFK